MRVLFDGKVPIAYAQFAVTSREAPGLEEAFAGQVNGICGARVASSLFLITGSHDGRVRLRVELHDREPPAAGPEWEEVVEVPFRPRAATVALIPWAGTPLAQLRIAADGDRLPVHRVRYCAAGMAEGRDPFCGLDPDVVGYDDPRFVDQRPDRYLLCFWPEEGEPRAETIVRQTSDPAASWHRWARALPAPPTLWEQVEAEVLKREETKRAYEEMRRQQRMR